MPKPWQTLLQEWRYGPVPGFHALVGGSVKIDRLLADRDSIGLGDISLQVIHTPGHSPGSVTLYWPAQKALFTGDLVFKEGVGRTDLPGGDGSQLKESIKGLMNLDVEYLLAGHGDIIAGAEKVEKNFEDVESFYFTYV